MANRAIVYCLKPNSEQESLFQQTFGHCRFVYNKMLEIQQSRYTNGEKHLSKIDANNYCNHYLKTEFPFLRDVDKFAITNAIYHLSDAYDRFFKKLGKFPKYKSKHISRKSYTTNITGNNIVIGDNYVKLPKAGCVKAVIHRIPDSNWKIKSATVSQNRDGTYQVSVLFEFDNSVITYTDKNIVLGLDYKSDGLYVDSNNNCCDMPHFYRKSHRKLRRLQRKLKHKTVHSNNYNKQQKQIAKLYRHIANQRKDFLHKKSTEIANQADVICVETLNMKAMSNKGFGNGLATLDNGYGMFLSMLEYKLSDRGKLIIKIDKWYPSSQTCHMCGKSHPEMKDLSIRVLKCNCGCNCDRDYNAAINIKNEGLRLLNKVA